MTQTELPGMFDRPPAAQDANERRAERALRAARARDRSTHKSAALATALAAAMRAQGHSPSLPFSAVALEAATRWLRRRGATRRQIRAIVVLVSIAHVLAKLPDPVAAASERFLADADPRRAGSAA